LNESNAAQGEVRGRTWRRQQGRMPGWKVVVDALGRAGNMKDLIQHTF